jgi:YggT family protein
MDNPYLSNAAAYMIETLFTLYLLMVLLRFLLQLTRADFYNPVCQFLIKATNPPLRPLRRFIPGLWGLDLASVVLLIALQMAGLWLVHVASGRTITLEGLFVLSIGELLMLTLNTLLIVIILQVILSWINPGAYNPLSSLLYSLSEPLLRPARRLLPAVSGLDFSPLIVLVLIQLAKMLVVAPIHDVGWRLAYG